MRNKLLSAALLIPCGASATTVVAVQTQTAVIISVDSKPTFHGGNGREILPSTVSKLHQKGSVVFAIIGLDNDPNVGLYFRDVIADSFEENDPFTTKISKAEKAVEEAIQTEIYLLKQRNKTELEHLLQEPYISGFFMADYSDSSPHLSVRTFKMELQPSPHLVAENCGGENYICYSGPRDTWQKEVQKVFSTTPDPLLASRTIVENDIKSFPEKVGPPVVSVVVDMAGVHWISTPK